MRNGQMGLRVLILAVFCALILPCTAGAATKAVVPLPSEASGATAGDFVKDESGAIQVYEDATPDSVQYLLKLLNFCGFAGGQMDMDGLDTFYAVYHLTSKTFAFVSYSEQKHQAYVQVLNDVMFIYDDRIQDLIDYYIQDLALPSKPGANILPQFYASIGRAKEDYGYILSDEDLPFNGDECWVEEYSSVTPRKMLNYLSDMVLCGFEASADFPGSLDSVDRVIYYFQNGDAEIVVLYGTSDQSAWVYYKPGVSYYLFSGAEYDKIIPKR